jgi:subtilisin family serine protease
MTMHKPDHRVCRAACAVLAAMAFGGPACAGGGGGGAGAVDGEIVVLMRARSEVAPLLVKHQLSLIGRFGARPIYRLKVIGKAKVKEKIEALRREPDVRSAEANVTYEGPAPRKNVAWAIGNAQDFAEQWALQATRLPEAHRISRGAGTRIAVLDTGVDRHHPALAGRLLPGFDFVDYDPDPSEEGSGADRSYGHGTHVAGLLALAAPEARIMPLRILDRDGVGNTWVLAEALLHAVDPDGNPATDDGAHVINLSISTLQKTELINKVADLVSCEKKPKSPKDDDDDQLDDGDVASPADRARCSSFGGAVVVAAAGNRGSDKVFEYPAAEKSDLLLSVAASDEAGRLASFSNYGWVKLAAPGDRITSTVPGGGYATWGGTSMAAPLAAGAAALLRSANPGLKPKDVARRLQERAAKLCDTSTKELDAAAALADRSRSGKRECGDDDR